MKIRGFDIAVNNPGFVRLAQALRHLDRNVNGFGERNGAACHS
jgi:hypothetical protein